MAAAEETEPAKTLTGSMENNMRHASRADMQKFIFFWIFFIKISLNIKYLKVLKVLDNEMLPYLSKKVNGGRLICFLFYLYFGPFFQSVF